MHTPLRSTAATRLTRLFALLTLTAPMLACETSKAGNGAADVATDALDALDDAAADVDVLDADPDTGDDTGTDEGSGGSDADVADDTGDDDVTDDTDDDDVTDDTRVVRDTTPEPDPVYGESFRVVHVGASVSLPEQLTVHACAGLYNRREGGSIFVQTDADVPQAAIDGAVTRDEQWLEPLGLAPAGTIEAAEFIGECVAAFGGCLRYSYETQHEILPSILTVAAARGIPPLADESPTRCTEPAFDATEVFADKTTQLLSTQYVFENHLYDTTGLAMLNPGYDRFAADPSEPALIDDMQVALVDLVFSRRLFVVFLINGCIDRHPEEALLSRIVNESGWPTPLGVYGYNDSWLAGGYVYEAQTRCLPSANMGAIPTRTTNLSFFDTRRPAITRPDELARNAPQAVSYDPSRTYVAFVIGDGDNIRYIMSTRRDWLDQRLARCRGAEPACPPLTWTMSPHLPDLAPDVLRWYFEAAASTGSDYFMLPPSGYQYAYPGMMPDAEQATFAAATERSAALLGTHSVIHWEWFQNWRTSINGFLPRYAREGGQIQGIFPVNVPYLLEAFPWWPAERKYQILTGDDGGRAVLFRSQSWRGIDDRDDFHPSPARMAERLGALPRGTVTWVYMTSDGGLNLENSYGALLDLLPEHVELVSTDAAAQLALEAGPR
jgi:hypothetical protein